MSRRLALGDRQRAELFQGLGRALSAGLDAVRALEALEGICDGALDDALRRTRNRLAAGRPLAASLDDHGLLGELDRALLATAEGTGTLGRVCLALAERYQRAWVRWQQMKGRMLVPGAVLVIGLLVSPLPALAGGTLTAGGYVLRTAAMLALLVLALRLAAAAVRRWRARGTPGWLTRLARLLPVAGPMSILHQRADACERLALALRCGLPAREALEGMRRVEANPLRRAACAAAVRAVAAGTPVAESLEGARLLDTHAFAIVSAGEAAGRLDDSLMRVAVACHDELDGRYDLLARWLPVLVYCAVAAFVVAGLAG